MYIYINMVMVLKKCSPMLLEGENSVVPRLARGSPTKRFAAGLGGASGDGQ